MPRTEQQVRIVSHDRQGTCTKCGASIVWATTAAGRKMPLESWGKVGALLAPALLQLQDVKGVQLRCWLVPASLTHFANCAKWRI